MVKNTIKLCRRFFLDFINKIMQKKKKKKIWVKCFVQSQIALFNSKFCNSMRELIKTGTKLCARFFLHELKICCKNRYEALPQIPFMDMAVKEKPEI